MTEAAENQELGWAPTSYDEDLDGLDRGDSVGLAETDEAQEAVAEEAETEALQEGGESDTVSEVPDQAEEVDEGSEEPEAVDTDDADEATVETDTSADAEAGKKKPHMIPKDRLDQELAKRRQLENKLKELEEKAQTAEKPPQHAEFDFDEAETRYMNAVLDGEAEKAKQIRAEIRQVERAQLQAELQSSMQETSQRTQAQIRLDNAVSEVVSKFPQLDVNGEAPDQDLINETNELMGGFLTAGYDPVDALNKAVGYTTASLGLNMDANEQAVIPNAKTRDLSAEKVAQRRQDGAEKREKATSQQPPKLSGESQRSRDENVVDIFKMSDKDLNNLSDEQLRKLRGDFG